MVDRLEAQRCNSRWSYSSVVLQFEIYSEAVKSYYKKLLYKHGHSQVNLVKMFSK